MKKNRDNRPFTYHISIQDSLQLSDSVKPGHYVNREVEIKIRQYLQDPEILVVRGPRQAGKTTIIKKIGRSLQEKFGKQAVHFFTFEDDLVRDKFIHQPQEFITHFSELNNNEKTFFLLDEVQYIKNAGKILKLIYDSYPQVKIIVTGSSSLDLNDLGKFLVGRALFFDVFPFSFAEFLSHYDVSLYQAYQQYKFNFDAPKIVNCLFVSELNKALTTYITYGGYPRVVLEPNREKKKFILKNLYNTYVEKDVIKLFEHQDRDRLLKLLMFLGTTLGQLTEYSEMSKVTGLNYSQIKKIISIFKQTYIIQEIRPYFKNQTTELKKSPKHYFFDLGLRNILLNQFEFDHQQKGSLLENYVCNTLSAQKVNYWRTTGKAEVDFILPSQQLPIEVKLQYKITRSLMSFIETYQPKMGVITDEVVTTKRNVMNTQLYIVPLCLI